MTLICGHVAIYVHDLRAAEEFYRRAFGMGLLFRETRREGDDWYALRPHVDWDGAEARGIQIGMVALRRDDFVLALFRGAPQEGTVVELGLAMSSSELDELQARLPDNVEGSSTALQFTDPFGFRWNVHANEVRFRSSGDIAGRWLD